MVIILIITSRQFQSSLLLGSVLLIAKENGSASAGRHILHSLCPLWQPEGHPGFYDSGLSCLVRLEGFATGAADIARKLGSISH